MEITLVKRLELQAGIFTPITEILKSDNLRERAIEYLDEKLRPYDGKCFPTAYVRDLYLTWLFLKAETEAGAQAALDL